MTNHYVQRATVNKTALLNGAWLFVTAPLILFGWMIPPDTRAQAQAQSDINLHFWVASIKHFDPARSRRGDATASSPGRFVADHWSLTVLAMYAYDLRHPFEIDGKLPWMSTELYDVEATVPAGTTKAQVRIMLQHLLTDRFGLMVHRETRQLRGYQLVVAKGGPKLTQPIAIGERLSDSGTGHSSTEGDVVIKNGMPRFSETAGTGELMTRAGTILRGRHNSIGGLKDQLAQVLQGPVLDGTGIEGEYDYDLSFQNIPLARPKESVGIGPDGSAVIVPANSGAMEIPGESPDSLGGPTIWDALKQLGLQLNTLKSVSVEVLVLDTGRRPTEN